ncbi:hypothetical protein C4K01_1793 [Pseudomonas synxantha]|nr:hypothetical protein C4K01_1793 [Pseudomonas synxantha]
MLAKIANDNAGILIHHRALKFSASKLAPTRHHSSGLHSSPARHQSSRNNPEPYSPPTANKIHLGSFAGATVAKRLTTEDQTVGGGLLPIAMCQSTHH